MHGTGGDENTLIPLGRELVASANILSPRGKVLENGAARFFRRLAEGVFDVHDLKLRTNELADFVSRASAAYGFDPGLVVALGYSNGANMAASLLLLRPETLSGAILMRPMIPLVPDKLPDLDGRRVLLIAGDFDQLVSRRQSEDLYALLQRSGAETSLRWVESDHSLGANDVKMAKEWLSPSFR